MERTDPVMHHYTRWVRPRVTTQSWDYTTAIVGPEGSSKSTLAMHLAHMTDPAFDPTTQVAFMPAEYARSQSSFIRM